MKKILSWIIGAPLAVILIALAVANRQEVRFSADPFRPDQPFFALEMPLYALLLFAVFVGLVFGAFGSWISQGKWRRAARDAQTEMSRLKHEKEILRRQSTVTGSQAVPALTQADSMPPN